MLDVIRRFDLIRSCLPNLMTVAAIVTEIWRKIEIKINVDNF